MRSIKKIYPKRATTASDACGAYESTREIPHAQVNYVTLFTLFLCGSVVGFVLEGLWNVLRLGFWEDHSALVWGPFCIIYGIAMAGLYAIADQTRRFSWQMQFVMYALLGSALEFFGSLLQEKLLGTVSWDYTHHFMNIGGRVSLQMTLIWGALGLCFAKLVFPFLARLFDRPIKRPMCVACFTFSLFMALNMTVSAGAILRWRERQTEAPSNAVETYLDTAYPDEKMQRIYPNMTFR